MPSNGERHWKHSHELWVPPWFLLMLFDCSYNLLFSCCHQFVGMQGMVFFFCFRNLFDSYAESSTLTLQQILVYNESTPRCGASGIVSSHTRNENSLCEIMTLSRLVDDIWIRMNFARSNKVSNKHVYWWWWHHSLCTSSCSSRLSTRRIW